MCLLSHQYIRTKTDRLTKEQNNKNYMLMLIETERVRKLYKFLANILVITVGLQFMRKLYIVLCHIVQSDRSSQK